MQKKAVQHKLMQGICWMFLLMTSVCLPLRAEDNGIVENATANQEEKRLADNIHEAKKELSESDPHLDIQAIYLNGVSGNDSESGFTKSQAVKTFAKAKSLLAENTNIHTIYITDTVTVEGDVSLSGIEAVIKREDSFSGYLFHVAEDKAAAFSDVVIDGNGELPHDKKSLLSVAGKLSIHQGTVLRNNQIVNTTNSYTMGGAISAYNASIEMDGGLICANQANYGAGIFLSYSSLKLSGGSIEKNVANLLFATDVKQYYAAGGGVLAYNGSLIELSGDASIRYNHSDEIGGGISVGGNDWSYGNAQLQMNGGIVDNNSAGSAGGGIFVQAGLNTQHAIATISGGTISNNAMDGSGATEKEFGGGGIYVNGMPEVWSGVHWTNGELYLKNVLIYDNHAAIAGAGYAACPVSKTYLSLTHGAAIFNNKAESAPDVYILSQAVYGIHGGKPEFDISSRMLGGMPYHWLNDEGEEVAEHALHGTLQNGNELGLHTNSQPDVAARALGKVFIYGNSTTTRGAGIGSNGIVYIGEKTDLKTLEVIKEWDEKLTPEEITVEVRGRTKETDWLIERVRLNAANHFRYVFHDLPSQYLDQDFRETVYVKEIADKPYKVSISAAEASSWSELSFQLLRPEFSEYENIHSTYRYNQSIYDEEENIMKDFTVTYTLHIDGQEITPQAKMSYSAENYQWNDKASFSGIRLDALEDVEIEYYSRKEEDDFFGEFLHPAKTEYDIYLVRKERGHWKLKIPKIFPISYFEQNKEMTGNEKIIEVKDISMQKNSRYIIRMKNEPSPIIKTQVSVQKLWSGSAPESVDVCLLADGEIVQIATLHKKDSWKYIFEDLPKTRYDNGQEIVYTIQELGQKGNNISIGGKIYEVNIEGNAADGFIIKNNEIPPKPPVPNTACKRRDRQIP